MAGVNYNGEFPEKISPFLKGKMDEILAKEGEDSPNYQALYLQYVKQPVEEFEQQESNDRHWHADIDVINDSGSLIGVERLYRHSAVIEPTMICAAHCRYCLRANYSVFTLSEQQLYNIACYCGSPTVSKDIAEVLITGGDPLIVPGKLMYLIECLQKYAPNINKIRIGTRLPLHDPQRIDNNVFEIFNRFKHSFSFELGVQVNHSVELFPEVRKVLAQVLDHGVSIYSQNVLLRGVNDDENALVNLYNDIRELGISPHYLFHSVPMRGMHHLRTSVRKGIVLTQKLVNSGQVSGRAKPMFAVMTDIGKITLYEGVILDKKDGMLLLQSNYRYTDRICWNPDWVIPHNAVIDDNGLLRVWYLDGND